MKISSNKLIKEQLSNINLKVKNLIASKNGNELKSVIAFIVRPVLFSESPVKILHFDLKMRTDFWMGIFTLTQF